MYSLSKNIKQLQKFGMKELFYRTKYQSTKDELAFSKMFIERDKYYSSLTQDQLAEEIAQQYVAKMGISCDICNPKKFTEKIQWMKAYDNSDIKSQLADKYRVREFISTKIGDKYLVPIIGAWERFQDINIDSLPDSFVLKMNHGSVMNYIVKDKNEFDQHEAADLFAAWVIRPYHAISLEMQYQNIPRLIIAENYIEELGGGLNDYKIHCFGGNPLFIQCIGDRIPGKHSGHQNHYDCEWNKLDWTFADYPDFPYEVKRPSQLEEMLEIAKVLSEGFKYVRVDLYEINNRVLFGEMTFTPSSGRYPYKDCWTEELDIYYGNCIKL